jgi:DNA-directed RNA polymerase specialized sigma24 family protein
MAASANGFFATTRWTMVRAAGASADDALESLCAAYWFPLYAYVRRHGFPKEDAEDLTQAFFAKLLERQDFTALKQENGRFRAFLLAALKNFLSNERDRRQTHASRNSKQTARFRPGIGFYIAVHVRTHRHPPCCFRSFGIGENHALQATGRLRRGPLLDFLHHPPAPAG